MPELRRRLTWVTLFRAVVVAVLLAATTAFSFSQEGGGVSEGLSALFVVSAAAFAVTLGYALWIAWGRDSSFPALAYVQVAGDTLLAAVLLWLTGGSDSPFAFLFSYGVINAAILRYRRGAMVAAALSTAANLGIVMGMRVAWIPVSAVSLAPVSIPLGRLVFGMAMNSGAFFLVAVLGSYLAEQVRQTGVKLEKAEAGYAALTALHEQIVESVSSGILTLDSLGKMSFLNRAGAQILQLEAGQGIGRPLQETSGVFARHLSEVQGPDASLQRGEVALGESHFIGYAGSALGDDGGRVIVFQDLTELKRMEARARRDERLVSLGAMAAGLAHEIRNPLASMSGSIELMHDALGASDPETSALMQIVLRETGRLEALVADFLQYARPRPPEFQPVSLSALLRSTLELQAQDPQLGEAHFELALDEEAVAWADPEQIRQVLLNLLLNAAQSGSEVQVCLRTRREGEQVVLEVEDDGPGLPEETARQVFDPFFTTKHKGTGLGLALAHNLIQAHSGQIEFVSRPGRGSCVSVRLPSYRAQAEQQESGALVRGSEAPSLTGNDEMKQ